MPDAEVATQVVQREKGHPSASAAVWHPTGRDRQPRGCHPLRTSTLRFCQNSASSDAAALTRWETSPPVASRAGGAEELRF